MALRIPQRYEQGFAKLIKYPPEKLDAVIKALGEAKPAFTVGEIASSVAGAAGVPNEDVEDFFQAVAGLYLLMEDREVTPDILAQDVLTAFDASKNPDLKLEGPARKDFAERLKGLLSFGDQLGVTAKALDVVLQHERTFCEAKVLTDVRPVFPLASDARPAAFVVVHTLKIRYHHGPSDGRDDFYVSLSGEALEVLKTVIERAKRKEDSVKGILKQWDLPILEDNDACHR